MRDVQTTSTELVWTVKPNESAKKIKKWVFLNMWSKFGIVRKVRGEHLRIHYDKSTYQLRFLLLDRATKHAGKLRSLKLQNRFAL